MNQKAILVVPFLIIVLGVSLFIGTAQREEKVPDYVTENRIAQDKEDLKKKKEKKKQLEEKFRKVEERCLRRTKNMKNAFTAEKYYESCLESNGF